MDWNTSLELLFLNVVEVEVGNHESSFLLDIKPVKFIAGSTVNDLFVSVSVELAYNFLIFGQTTMVDWLECFHLVKYHKNI